MSLVGSVGGAYGALLNKKKEKRSGDAPKPKVAKVMSLKDTKEKNPAVKKDTKEAKKPEPKKKEEQKEEQKDLTKREVKAEQKSHDRRPRSGHAPETKGQKSDIVSDALEAAAEKGDDKDERQKEAEERAAREAEEAKKMTFADFEKAREEKRKELNMKTSERKVDDKQFAKMHTVVAAKDNNDFMQFSKKDSKAKGGAAKGANKEKKGKFVKTETVQLGFFSKPAQAPKERNFRPRREEKKPEEKKTEEQKTE